MESKLATSSSNLRFAPIIRVSTEAQKDRGESLRTQREQIKRAVSDLGGIIPESCWRYSGQEHATSGQEREKLTQLLQDSDKGIFDAVIVTDASRWSRDNRKNKEGLEILRGNGIRFFVGGTEYYLHNPEHAFFLGMATEINEFQARSQAYKSLINRIARAERGIPTAGKLPYGRTFDKKTNTWGIDSEKQKLIKWVAKEYLREGHLEKIAQQLHMNHANLHKILTKRAGDIWEIHFHDERFNIDETVTFRIPPLLDEKTIEAIHARKDANKTYLHGQLKHKYLLARMIFCSKCGYALFGQRNHSGKRYYRHSRHGTCRHFNSIPADLIEDAVVTHLFSIRGDVPKIKEAVQAAIPDLEEIRHLEKKLEINRKELERIRKAKDRLLDMVEKGALDTEEVRRRNAEHIGRERLLKSHNASIEVRLATLPRKKDVSRRADLMQRVIKSYLKNPEHLKEMSFADKRKFLQSMFEGNDPEGKRCGVYVERRASAKKPWFYTIKGVFVDDVGRLPLSEEEKEIMLGKPVMRGERHAHHRQRLHQ